MKISLTNYCYCYRCYCRCRRCHCSCQSLLLTAASATTTTIIILQGFAFLCKLGLLLFKNHWDNEDTLSHLRHRENGLLISHCRATVRSRLIAVFEKTKFILSILQFILAKQSKPNISSKKKRSQLFIRDRTVELLGSF